MNNYCGRSELKSLLGLAQNTLVGILVLNLIVVAHGNGRQFGENSSSTVGPILPVFAMPILSVVDPCGRMAHFVY